MDKEPLEAQETIRLTLDEMLELSLQEWKKRLVLPSNIVEANPSHNPIADNDKKDTSDQPTRIITDKAEEK